MIAAVRKYMVRTGGALGIGCVLFGAQMTQAFDGKTTADIQLPGTDMTPSEALRTGARQYYAGDKSGALTSLRYAAENGQSMAAWKLGKMYATGDGVKEDDLQAFEYYSQIVRQHGEDRPDGPDAPFVASAFVALGTYYLNGIGDHVRPNKARARQIFTHAASYFGDPDAQYELGRLYQQTSSRMAVRWYNLAAIKGHVGAQARLGEVLLTQGTTQEQHARGLMWLTIAHQQAGPGPDSEWISVLHEQYFSLSTESVRVHARDLVTAWFHQNGHEMAVISDTPSQ